MDEILIGEKKYVSSKRAAKVTGYAKDYIGQLCREGRVPARLVGRSWYVLETAIHDHRFGDQKIEREIETAPSASVFSPTWESPRYEATSTEALPSVNRLRDAEKSRPAVDQEGNFEVSQHLQDSWKAWFDRVAIAEPAALAIPEPEKGQKDEEMPKETEEEVNVPVHAVYRQPPEELLPLRINKNSTHEEYGQEMPRQAKRRKGIIIQTAGALVAMLAAVLAVLGTGYFDEYIISNSQVGIVAGVALYNK